ncbi:epithelial cell-transforming sequence 2 oncogene-like [Clupea harengus]|uniref:Epithelial cell-transforming sequence 2 oncogene-like n=1 Tax=Clupea harengus TaxID=7950 RepID=A0A6P8G9P4_CLUHA|nr:epithelial cell-transforming sequence 2 oncogene-like [Clupea harengus]
MDGLLNEDVSEVRFSAWTPIINKSSNQQLFQERTSLVFHWFDLWTDRQRKQFMHALLLRCSKSQRKFIRDWLMEVVPIKHMDFTSVLPRCLSLYILSFLNPMELCKAAQVSWHWKFLAEQDCLWSDRCVRRGWFLPYTPSNREFGAWKAHYISCASSLDYLTPREAAEVYGTLNETVGDTEEKKERLRECMIRKAIREKGAEYKRGSMKSRRAWLSNSWTAGSQATGVHGHQKPSGMELTSSLVTLGEKCRSQLSLQDKEEVVFPSKSSDMEQTSLTTSMRSLYLSSAIGSHMNLSSLTTCPGPPAVHLVLISSRVLAYELLLAGARVSVVTLLYDYSAVTLELLLSQAQRLTQGRRVRSIGLVTEGDTEEINIIQGLTVNESTVLNPKVREFWEKISGWIIPPPEGGSLDIFLPLAASASGANLVRKLSSLTGLGIRVPSGICTGSYQHILSEWCGPGEFPPLMYFSEGPLLSWCWQAEWLEEALRGLRELMWPQLQQLSKETQGRTLGRFLCDRVNLPDILVKSEVTAALTEALMALCSETPEKPLEFLARFMQRRYEGSAGMESEEVFLTEKTNEGVLSPLLEVPQDSVSEVNRRLAVIRELKHSESRYIQHLQSVTREYYTPLRAALDSNRAILSSANILMVFAPVLEILEVNSLFLRELTERLGEWSPQQCVGDICKKFCTKLWVYTNFFNNYPTILKTIDKCKEMLPAFRSFLKRHDRTPSTYMLSLQELLLGPSARVEEYVTLLQALSVHTPPEHQDHGHLTSALNTVISYRSFLRKLKRSSEGDVRMRETQRMIQSCPNLKEGDRYLITTQNVALLKCPNEDITTFLRMYEQVRDLGLFLFNDALVLSERCVSHLPYSHALRTSYTFLASVALRSLILRDIADTKYVQNAFVLEGPKRQWICATERQDDKLTWLSALKSAISAAIKDR